MLLLLLSILLLAMLLLMLMLSIFVVVACDASAHTTSDMSDSDASIFAYVVVSRNAIDAVISNVVAAFNIFVTRTYIWTRIIRTVRM